MKEKRKEQNEKIRELTEKLHNGIQELYESDKYKDYLRTMAKIYELQLQQHNFDMGATT